MGGLEVDLIIEDDGFKPAIGKQKTETCCWLKIVPVRTYLLTVKLLTRDQMERTTTPVVGIMSFMREACMSAKFMSMTNLTIVASMFGLLVSLR